MKRKSYRSFKMVTLLLTAALFSGNLSTAQCPTGAATITTVPNTYYPGLGTVAAGATSINLGTLSSLGASTTISAGDMVMIIQMQGADIQPLPGSAVADANYGANTGTGKGYLSNGNLLAGNMEFAIASNAVGSSGTLNVTAPLVNSYKSQPYNWSSRTSKFTYQVIRVPRYFDLKLGADITTPAWDGVTTNTGGVIVLDVVDTLDFNGHTIDASRKGFAGGGGIRLTAYCCVGSLVQDNYAFGVAGTVAGNQGNGGAKGEGISGTPAILNSFYNATAVTSIFTAAYLNGGGYLSGGNDGYRGKGSPGNAGGGADDWIQFTGGVGNGTNNGGGGGSNGGQGGNGGNPCCIVPTVTGGEGLGAVSFAQGTNKRMILGGGGGAGSSDDGTGDIDTIPAGAASCGGSGFASSGGMGGGIVVVYAKAVKGTGSITADGETMMRPNKIARNDGTGGGGAGGSISVYVIKGNGLSNITLSAKGGNGASNFPPTNYAAAGVCFTTLPPPATTQTAHGPGGGGGGGTIYTNQPAASINVSGGAAGFTQQYGGAMTNFAAVAGTSGVTGPSSLIPGLDSCIVVLPVKLSSFTGEALNCDAMLSWKTSEEINFSSFDIEYSTNGKTYFPVGTVAGKNSNTGNIYSFNYTPQAGTGYYRLKMIDQDNRFEYSNIITVRTQCKLNPAITLHPNPTTHTAYIDGLQQGSIIKVYGTNGQLLTERKTTKTTEEINLSDRPSGTYTILIINEAGTSVHKLTVLH